MNDELKRQAAVSALDEIKDGMVVGLGTGSTTVHFIRELGALVKEGLSIRAVPTSESSRALAEELGIELTTLASDPRIDVTVDGADEVSPQLDLIKGLGGALVREKVVAHASARVVIIVDESKLVATLGEKVPIPVEVIPFALDFVRHHLTAWGGLPVLREKAGRTFVSDNGNYVIDWRRGEIAQPAALEKQIKGLTGVVDSGIFCQVAQRVIVAGADGVRRIDRHPLLT